MPLVSNVKVDKSVEAPATPAQAQTVLPIFETSLETQNPIEDLTPEHKSTDKDKVGYFELDGKLHKGYITPLTVIDGIEVHVTKVPNITKGFGRQGEVAHVASNSFYAVFPNGKTFLFLNNNPVQGGKTQEEVEKAIKKALEGNKQRVKDLSSEKTILFDPDTVPTVSAAPVTTVETPATINQGNTQTGAAYTVQKEQAIDNKKASRTRHKLRKVKSPDYERWDEKRELEWLNKVLPQLSESDRVKVVKGLIKVGRQGALAWGQFDKGVITLSDIAAEGTAYHEAFHAVFNLMLDINERKALYDEARKLYGDKDNLSLEEDMAEGFREYVMTRQHRGLGRRILDFFKDLLVKVTNWNNFRPSLISYYRAIDGGKYANVKYTGDNKGAVDYIYNLHPELNSIGTKDDYLKYIRTIYPNSLVTDIYWHGSDSDFSEGLSSAKRGKGSGASETGNEMYFNKQPWTSIQYVSGQNRNIPDEEGYSNWVKLWWEMKEILGNGRMDTDDWKMKSLVLIQDSILLIREEYLIEIKVVHMANIYQRERQDMDMIIRQIKSSLKKYLI